MRTNRSPWLHQLDMARPTAALAADLRTDVVIVGAGIAGITTAFFTLKHTHKKVVLLEKFKLAHGATGHNAGQVASYFEKGFKGLVEEFGMKRAAEGQQAIYDAWQLLEEMYADAALDIFFERGMGHDGFSTYAQVVEMLEEIWLKREASIAYDHMAISLSAPFLHDIPQKYAGLYRAVPQRQVLEMLETDNEMFMAVSTDKRGCVNSALLCEKVLAYLQEAYSERFSFFEHAPVHKIILRKDTALLDAENHTVLAKRVVLCTNGFENLHIINEHGLEVDAKYHANVRGRVAYMSAYLEPQDKPPVATSYMTPEEPTENLPYYYLTRRPYEYEPGEHHNLICIGGPEEPFEDEQYMRESEYPEYAKDIVDRFIKDIYDPKREELVQYAFTWHGLMGYTANGVRMVGPEPKNKVLLYNLGCNGVGILPSIMGGRTIARHIAGEEVQPSIFDVPERMPSSVELDSKMSARS